MKKMITLSQPMKNKIAITTCTTVLIAHCLLAYTPSALADTLNLKVSPSQITIKAKPSTNIQEPFTIENQSDQPVSLTIGYKIIKKEASANGTIVFLANDELKRAQEHNVLDTLQIVDKENNSLDTIELGPKQKKNLQLRISLASKKQDNDYYFSLIFLSKENNNDQSGTKTNNANQASTSIIHAGIATNIFVAVGEKTASQGEIISFTTPWFRQSGPVPFSITISNHGNHYIEQTGYILIKNLFGQTVGKITLPQSIVLAGTTRKFDDNEQPSSRNMMIWPEHFLFGLYTATLSIKLEDHEPVTDKTIHFIALPLKILCIFVTSLLALLIIASKVRKALKRK
jgi:hypothetical protein